MRKMLRLQIMCDRFHGWQQQGKSRSRAGKLEVKDIVAIVLLLQALLSELFLLSA